MASKVRIRDLTKRFGNTIAVNKLNLEIRAGEFVCFLGPSGCGKTTTLRCIAGLERQDEGDIYIDDDLVNDLSPAERDIAMVFQFPVVYPATTVKDNLEFPLKQRRLPKDEIRKRVNEIAKALRIEHVLNRVASDLNIGEKQRVAIGRAIIRSPKVLLLDEALTNLDTEMKLSMIAELKRIHEEFNQTIVYVTHDQSEAMMMADRIAVMNLGVLQQYDTPEELYSSPRNLFVAGFIGSPPMNLINAKYIPEKSVVQINNFYIDVSNYREIIDKKISSNELVLGFRPEYAVIHKVCQSSDHLKGEVEIVELLEDRLSLDIRLTDQIIKVLVPGTYDMSIGDQVCVELNKFHLFDEKTGETIL
ncbi:MAG: ABC transporter ATP-binding protein, partial [Halobacteria archaeon]